jgi:hypothetical protein
MRDLLFKNLTSYDKKRKILTSSEVVDNHGVRSIIRRHFICLVKQVNMDDVARKPQPCLYVLKERQNKEQLERFICRIKGSICASSKDKHYLIYFMHSLQICIQAVPTGNGEEKIF